MESIDTETPDKTKIGRPRRLRDVDLIKVQKQLHVVLKREVLNLMDQSHAGKLSQESSRNLINYLKLLKDLADTKAAPNPDPEPEEPENFIDLTDEELKALAAKPTHGDQK